MWHMQPVCNPMKCRRTYESLRLFVVQKAHPTANCRLTCRSTERNDCACNNNRRDHYYFGHFDVLVELLGSPGNTNRHMPGMCGLLSGHLSALYSTIQIVYELLARSSQSATGSVLYAFHTPTQGIINNTATCKENTAGPSV